MYAHYLAKASWAGARIIQGQWTARAEKLYDLLILTFSDNGKLADLTELEEKAGLSPTEWEDLMQYTIQVCDLSSASRGLLIFMPQVLSNLVNYRTFGFTKIVPRVPMEKFEAVVKASSNATRALALWSEVSPVQKVPDAMNAEILSWASYMNIFTPLLHSQVFSSANGVLAMFRTIIWENLSPTVKLQLFRRQLRKLALIF